MFNDLSVFCRIYPQALLVLMMVAMLLAKDATASSQLDLEANGEQTAGEIVHDLTASIQRDSTALVELVASMDGKPMSSMTNEQSIQSGLGLIDQGPRGLTSMFQQILRSIDKNIGESRQTLLQTEYSQAALDELSSLSRLLTRVRWRVSSIQSSKKDQKKVSAAELHTVIDNFARAANELGLETKNSGH